MIAFGFILIPVLRVVMTSPARAASLLAGAFFVAGAAVGLGFLARTPKLFIVLFLLLLYGLLNSGGQIAVLDFANFYGVAGLMIPLLYAGVAAVLCAFAVLRHRMRTAT